MSLSDKKLPGFSMTLYNLITSKTFWATLATITTTGTAAYKHEMPWSMALPIIFIAIGQFGQRDATQAQTNAATTPTSAE